MGWQTCCSYLREKYMTWTLFGQNQACNNLNSILILMSVWHATVHQHPVRAEADIIVRCYAPTNSGKSDKVAHSAVESPRGAQTNAQMLRVNGLQHVPDPWQPSSEAWIWKPRNLCCAGARARGPFWTPWIAWIAWTPCYYTSLAKTLKKSCQWANGDAWRRTCSICTTIQKRNWFQGETSDASLNIAAVGVARQELRVEWCKQIMRSDTRQKFWDV